MSKQLEKPFEYLRRLKDGSCFEDAIIGNWYIARAYVLDKLKEVAFQPDDDKHLHVVISNDSSLMLSVARQVALSAHYINFDDSDVAKKEYRTVITIVSHNDDILNELTKEEHLFHLSEYCKCKVFDKGTTHPDSFVDLEIEVVNVMPKDDGFVLMTEEEAEDYRYREVYAIDTRKAVYASRMYNLGAEIDNLPYEDIHSTQRYSQALDAFQFKAMLKEMDSLVKETDWKDVIKVKEGLSNLFCSDCFESRAKAVKEYAKANGLDEKKAWEECNKALSKSEHARWVAEKLIMGYRPVNAIQRIRYESLFGDARKQYAKSLKQNKDAGGLAHIDLCSYADLRRIEPDHMKYDSFLVLGIPEILAKVK